MLFGIASVCFFRVLADNRGDFSARQVKIKFLMGLIVVFGSLFFVGCGSVLAGEAAGKSLLREARAQVRAGHYADADAFYKKIPYGTHAWSQKLIDGIRYNLIEGNFTEAWRLTQLESRTGIQKNEVSDYYRSLSLTLAGSCPLGLAGNVPTHPEWESLLFAYGYRYAEKFRSDGFVGEPEVLANQGILSSYLGAYRTFYLDDIAQAFVLPSMGCRLVRNRFNSLDVSESTELRHLSEWYWSRRDIPANRRISGYMKVESRLLELVGRKLSRLKRDQTSQISQTKKVEKTLNSLGQKEAERGFLRIRNDIFAYYKTLSMEEWLKVSEPENMFIWGVLAKYSVFPQLPIPGLSERGQIIKKMILSAKSPKAVYWLGLVDYDTWSVVAQVEILEHLLKIEDIEMRAYLLNHKAWLLYFLGRMQDSLAIIRELTVEGASGDNSEIDRSAVELGSLIFTEYKYNTKMMGAIQSSLPAKFWGRIFRGVLIDLALAGNVKIFSTVKKQLFEVRRMRSTGLSKKQLKALKWLLRRNLNKFAGVLKSWETRRGVSGEFVRYAQFISEQTYQLEPRKRRAFAPYLLLIAKGLQRAVGRTSSRRKIEELISVFDPTQKFGWTKGSASVRRGSIEVGVADLRAFSKIVRPYPWKAPRRLPKRRLLVMPTSIVATKGVAAFKEWAIR